METSLQKSRKSSLTSLWNIASCCKSALLGDWTVLFGIVTFSSHPEFGQRRETADHRKLPSIDCGHMIRLTEIKVDKLECSECQISVLRSVY